MEKCTRDIPNARNDYLEALIASYGASESKVTRIQILSIIVDLMPYNDIKKLLPEVTDNKLYQAKKQLLRRYDFSEPQAGKGPCDRNSTNQKSHVTRYLNEGNDVMTALDIKRALEPNNGVKVVVPYVVEGVPVSCTKVPKITGNSLLHNFQYHSNRLRVWKAFDIGNGKLLKWNEFNKNSQCFPQEHSVAEGGDIDRAYVFATASKKAQRHDVRNLEGNEGIWNSTMDESAMFYCPESGCVKQYVTWGSTFCSSTYRREEFTLGIGFKEIEEIQKVYH